MQHEPYKIKSVRNINFLNYAERKEILQEVNFNVGLIPSSKVLFDMVTQGTSAMSQEQLGAFFVGDEAYAGARNFYKLTDAIFDVFGFKYVCPTHNLYGGIKLLCSIDVKPNKLVMGNTAFPDKIVKYFKGEYILFPTFENKNSPKNLDFDKTQKLIEQNKGKIPFLYLDLQDDCGNPVSFEFITRVKKLADASQIKLIINTSCIAEYAFNLLKNDSSFANKSLKDVIKIVSSYAHIVIFDAGQDAMSNVGGFLATNDINEHEKQQNEVVVYEGLHTYGGMAGRTMEVVAYGIKDMAEIQQAEWINHQVTIFANFLKKANVPFIKGFNGIYLDVEKIWTMPEGDVAHCFAAALFLSSGVRVNFDDCYDNLKFLPILLPRRALMNTQIEQIAEAIILTIKQKDSGKPMLLTNKPIYHSQAKFKWDIPTLGNYNWTCEPYTIHSVEYVGMKSREDRLKAVQEAGYNTFLLKSEDVTIDLLTDSGTSAMSVEQWTKYFQASETPATPDAYHEIVKTSQEIYGYKHIILTHQGRAAEHIMSQMFIKQGDYVPGNMYFTTTKLHQEIAGGTFVDVIVDEAHNTQSNFPWKGNVDIKKMENIVRKAKEEKRDISYLSYEFNVNMAGGQPVSMENMKEIYGFCKEHRIPVFFDATRCAENACFIQRNDPKYKNVPVKDILLEMMSYGDGATISSKKDMLSNLSGTLIFRDNEEWFNKGMELLQIFEGTYCSGGTSAGDMLAHAQGLREMVNDRYINNRIEQIQYLGKLLQDAEIPIVLPSGGHAIFLDAKSFLSHIDQDEFPAQMLAAQLFIETGMRAMERGNVSKGRDPLTNQNYRPKLELVRLTIPRRVYTRDHLKAVADGIINLYKKRQTIKGLTFVYEPEKLRFFQGRFKEL